jgi:hypothetical protein
MGTGNCAPLDGTLTRTLQGTDVAQWTFGSGVINLQCVGGQYVIIPSGIQDSVTYVSFTASPFELVADVDMSSSPTNPCTGTFRVTITDP